MHPFSLHTKPGFRTRPLFIAHAPTHIGIRPAPRRGREQRREFVRFGAPLGLDRGDTKTEGMTLPPTSTTTPFTHFVGIDVAKATLAVDLRDARGRTLLAEQVTNDRAAVAVALLECLRACGSGRPGQRAPASLLVACEHTGQLSCHVVAVARDLGIACWRVDAQLLAGAGAQRRRGKSDPADARDIGEYARRYYDGARLEPSAADEVALSRRAAARRVEFVVGARAGLVEARKRLRTQLKEIAAVAFGTYLAPDDACATGVRGVLEEAVANLSIRICECDRALAQAMADEAIAGEVKLARSCPGVGAVLAAGLVVVTHGFTRMRKARQLAAHACVAPYEHTSGTSVRGRARTNKQGHGGLKATLTMAAMSTVKNHAIFEVYYQRRRDDGKAHLVALNAVRNKILHVVCACVRTGVMYDENLHKPASQLA